MQGRNAKYFAETSGKILNYNFVSINDVTDLCFLQNNVQICADLGWEYLNGECYKLITEEKSWQEAQEHCQTLGSKLAEPQSPCESDLLHYFFQFARPRDATEKYAWIGINDIDTENTFVFASNGQPVPYNYWNVGEPSNDYGHGDCVHLFYKLSDGKWNDIQCSWKKWFICERRHFDGISS